MIEVKPLGGVYVDSETAQLFIGLQHLEPDQCIEYLIGQLINPELITKLDEMYIDLLRLTTALDHIGFDSAYNLGNGTIHIFEQLLGTDIAVCQVFLSQVFEKLMTVKNTPVVPGFTPIQRSEVIFELQASITAIVGYMRYLLELGGS